MRPFPSSICHGCVWHRLISSSKGATFVMCTEPTLPKYRSQPVDDCARFDNATDDDSGEQPA